MARWRILVNLVGGLLLAGIVLLPALARWAITPYEFAEPVPVGTARDLLKVPFATRIVIGDSRVEFGTPVGPTLFMGYGGATFPEMERLTKLTCRLSRAQVTLALGVNDALPRKRDLTASYASLDRIIAACGAERLRLALVWPIEPDVKPSGDWYDLAAIGAINQAMIERAAEKGIALIPAPAITGHTLDGVHFTPAASARYMAILGAAH